MSARDTVSSEVDRKAGQKVSENVDGCEVEKSGVETVDSVECWLMRKKARRDWRWAKRQII